MPGFARSCLVLSLVVILAGCQGAGASRVFAFTTLNDSGVSGSVTLSAVDDQHTKVDVEVSPAGHNDMPAHIHPGTCGTLVPQPKYPLQNVQFGHSTTVLAASFADLSQGGLALNIHSSNEDMTTYTACAELR